MITNIIAWIVLGALAGWLASLVTGRDSQMGAVANIIVGIVGAFVGGLLMNLFGAAGVTGFNIYSLVVALIGAVVTLFLVSFVQRAA